MAILYNFAAYLICLNVFFVFKYLEYMAMIPIEKRMATGDLILDYAGLSILGILGTFSFKTALVLLLSSVATCAFTWKRNYIAIRTMLPIAVLSIYLYAEFVFVPSK